MSKAMMTNKAQSTASTKENDGKTDRGSISAPNEIDSGSHLRFTAMKVGHAANSINLVHR